MNEVTGDTVQFYTVSFGRVRKISVINMLIKSFLDRIFEVILSMENGGGRTRTAELRRGGIYSPLQLPLCDTPRKKIGKTK